MLAPTSERDGSDAVIRIRITSRLCHIVPDGHCPDTVPASPSAAVMTSSAPRFGPNTWWWAEPAEFIANPGAFWRHLTSDSQLRWIGPDRVRTHLGLWVRTRWDLRHGGRCAVC